MNTRLAITAACVATLAIAASAQSLLRSVSGPAASAQFGKACITVPDQNGDGFKDVLVGAPGFNSERGAIYCVSGAYLGNPTGSAVLWSLAPTASPGDRFGAALADVGDVTGDGVHDFLVGQPGYGFAGANDLGAVRLVSGASHAVLSLIQGAAIGALLGTAVAATGDLDLDGKCDVLIGTPSPGHSESDLYFVTGSRLSTSGSITALTSAYLLDLSGAELGSSIAGNFDNSNSGGLVSSTFVAGAPGYDAPAGADAGLIVVGRLILGGGSPTFAIVEDYVSTTAGERLGTSVDAAHDYDGDGRADIVAGAPNSPGPSGTRAGRAVVLSTNRLYAHTPPFEIYQLTTGGSTIFDYHFGAAVRACADLNGDGIGEILVGAPDYSTALFALNKGFVAIHSGATGVKLATIVGANGDHFGDALAGAVNDLDGDGFKEFVFAGGLSDVGGTDSGVLECYRLFPLAPATYCAGKLSSLGCTPAIAFTGTPSANSAAPFAITATNFVNQKNGLLFYSHAPTSVPFQGGTKCVANPTVRTPPMNSGGATSGSSCSGTYSFDFNAWIANGWDSTLAPGSEIYAQYWSRDPASASHTGLSNALRFVINP